MTLSDYCKQKDRIKEELKWKREQLEQHEESLKTSDDFEQLGEIESLNEDIKELENEWDELHGIKKITLEAPQIQAINALIDEKLNDLGVVDHEEAEIILLESIQRLLK